MNDTAVKINFIHAPALDGLRWVTGSLGLLKKQPLLLHLAALMFFSTILVLQAIPLIGQAASVMLLPVFTVGLLKVIELVSQKKTEGIRTINEFWSGFKLGEGLKRLLLLGSSYFLALMFIAFLVYAIDTNNVLQQFAQAMQKKVITRALIDELSNLMLWGLVLYVPVSAAFWFAPQLVGWHAQGVGKSIFFSLAACWRNKAAFSVYALSLGALFAVLTGAVSLFGSLTGAVELQTNLLFAASLFFLVVFYISGYVSYAQLVVVSGPAALATTELFNE